MSVWGYVHVNAGTQGEVLAGLELKLQVVSPMPWVLGIRLRSSARAVHALNLGVIYPALPASRHSLKKTGFSAALQFCQVIIPLSG